MRTKKNLTLAIETAIEGGSLSISDDTGKIGFWEGKREISKAEDVLEAFAELLDGGNFGGANFSNIAVSKGVGSATGLKIGLATAKGLARAFGCRLLEVSLWDALAAEVGAGTSAAAAIFLPHGKNAACFRKTMNKKIISETEIASIEYLRNNLKNCLPANTEIFAQPKIYREIFSLQDSTLRINNIGGNLAGYILNFASDNDLTRCCV